MTLDMNGAYPLTDKDIDANVKKGVPGNYALGRTDPSDKKFIVKYVGRSDTDLNKRLHDWVGKGYAEFKFSYASSVGDAFNKECRNFHDFGGIDELDNDIHPARPEKASYPCPRCDTDE